MVTENEVKAIVFHSRRFGYKHTLFDQKTSYLDTWIERFNTGNPQIFMDSESIDVYIKMCIEGDK